MDNGEEKIKNFMATRIEVVAVVTGEIREVAILMQLVLTNLEVNFITDLLCIYIFFFFVKIASIFYLITALYMPSNKIGVDFMFVSETVNNSKLFIFDALVKRLEKALFLCIMGCIVFMISCAFA